MLNNGAVKTCIALLPAAIAFILAYKVEHNHHFLQSITTDVVLGFVLVFV